MTVLADLFRKCRAGDRDACRRFIIWAYLLPRLEDALRDALKAPGVIVLPIPQPDPPPFVDTGILKERNLLQALDPRFLGEPHPQPSFPSPVDQLEAAVTLKKSLTDTVAWLDGEIQRLEKQQCRGQ
jgi:hypothetical protein